MASDGLGLPGPATLPEPAEPYYLPPPRRKFQHRWWRHIVLFVLTIATTAFVGAGYYASFASAFGTQEVAIDLSLFARGLIFSCAVLGILGAHEMGHYLACRWYNVDATLPFFLPFPFLSISGTLGAVIKIREPFPNRRALFDIAAAGPIAGFVVLVPVLVYALSHSTLVETPTLDHGIVFGEPLLFKAVTWLTFGSVGDRYQLNLHPVGFGAWFGMLATAWNLLPFGQLDGGHIAYAAMGHRARYLSYGAFLVSVALCFVSSSWILLTLLMLAALYFFGPGHPRPLNDYDDLGTGRQMVALVAIVMFALCFTPVPITILP